MSGSSPEPDPSSAFRPGAASVWTPGTAHSVESTSHGGRTTNESPASIARGFLFADLRGYSAWVERHGDHAAAALIREYRDLVRQAVADHRGAEIKTEGDSFYVAFDSPSAAVRCGLRILELAAANRAAAVGPIPVGIGVHAGETVATEEGFVGSAVNIAARVCGEARAGQLLVTDAVRSLTRTYLDVGFEPVGRRRLKGIAEPIGLYRVTRERGTAAVPAWRRLVTNRLVVAAAVAIPLILVVALIGGALVREAASGPGSEGSGTPTPDSTVSAVIASASATPSGAEDLAFPTPGEARLVQLIPGQYRESCARADPDERPIVIAVPPGEEPPPGEPRVIRTVVAAGIECDLGGIAAPDRVWYWDVIPNQPADGDNARVALRWRAGRVLAVSDDCREGHPAIEPFAFGGTSGELLCYETNEGDAVLEWVFDGAELYGTAIRDDRDMAALLDWWDVVGKFTAP